MTDLYSHPSVQLQAVHVCTLVAVRFPCVAVHSADASEGLTQMNPGGSERLCGRHGIGCTRCLQPLRPWQATPTTQKSCDESEIRVVHIQRGSGQMALISRAVAMDPWGTSLSGSRVPLPCHSRPDSRISTAAAAAPCRPGPAVAIAVGERELPQCSQKCRRGCRKPRSPQLARRASFGLPALLRMSRAAGSPCMLCRWLRRGHVRHASGGPCGPVSSAAYSRLRSSLALRWGTCGRPPGMAPTAAPSGTWRILLGASLGKPRWLARWWA
jgi:hypothetical protein